MGIYSEEQILFSTLNMNLVKINPTNLSWITNANFNTFTQTGLYTIGSNPENGTYPFSILYVFAPREDTIFQMVERNSHIYVREYRNSSWQDWREL